MKRTVKKVLIALNLQDLDSPGLVSLLRGIVTGFTGNAYFTTSDLAKLPVSLADMGTQATDLDGTHTLRLTNKSKTLTATEHDQATTVMDTLTATKGFVETFANKQAAGDMALAVEIITSVGFDVKAEFIIHQRKFEVVGSIKTKAHLRIQAPAKRFSVLWQWTATPLAPVWSFPIVGSEVEVIISTLRSGGNYGFRYGIVLPVGRGNKRTVAAGSEQPVWSDLITAVIP